VVLHRIFQINTITFIPWGCQQLMFIVISSACPAYCGGCPLQVLTSLRSFRAFRFHPAAIGQKNFIQRFKFNANSMFRWPYPQLALILND
jgi:hypothetical protein